ncbi:MAG: alpha/beta hydrolase, partial [Clostridia bacterium]|nr:alpha/beta hydrolase [Clostridia bacterium]
MALSAKTIKKQLHLLKPLLSATSLETCRRGQNKLGELMGARQSGRVLYKEHAFADFTGAWVIPKDERRQGVLLYLHGGGYTCGNLEYAKGVAANLAVQSGTRVFCAAYRLAPEHRFPCALEDAMCAYRYLLDKGYTPRHITLCGESAGGGLCYALCLKLKEENLPLPCGIIAFSPWTDLTASGESYTKNREADPSISQKVLSYYADCYCDDKTNPLVSPLFGDM